jgi:hypothetical protein
MIDEQQDALTGKLIREHATLLKEIATLEAVTAIITIISV